VASRWAKGACGAVVESGWRGNETAHLTNEPPRRDPLDDTGCATEARCAMAHGASRGLLSTVESMATPCSVNT